MQCYEIIVRKKKIVLITFIVHCKSFQRREWWGKLSIIIILYKTAAAAELSLYFLVCNVINVRRKQSWDFDLLDFLAAENKQKNMYNK